MAQRSVAANISKDRAIRAGVMVNDTRPCRTRDTWGDAQAERYIRGLFERFAAIAGHRFPWRPVPAEFGVDGYVCRHERHFIYWKLLSDLAWPYLGVCAPSSANLRVIEALENIPTLHRPYMQG